MRFSRIIAAFSAAIIVLTLLFYQLAPANSINAYDIDCAESAIVLGNSLTNSNESLRSRIQKGFELPDEHPKTAAAAKLNISANRTQPPLCTWTATLSLILAPSDSLTNYQRLKLGSSLLFSLFLVIGFAWLWRQFGALAATCGSFAWLLGPTSLDPAKTSTLEAGAMLAILLFIMAAARLARSDKGALWAGLSLGVCWMVHPAAIFLTIAVFIVYGTFQAKQTTNTKTEGLTLPSIPLSVLAIPLIALSVLILSWGALYSQPFKGVGQWFLSHWASVAPDLSMMGSTYQQTSDKAPNAIIAVVQLLTGLHPLVQLTAFAGLFIGISHRTVRNRDNPTIQLTMWSFLGVLLMAGIDGSGFSQRNTLSPWVVTLAGILVSVAVAHLCKLTSTHSTWSRIAPSLFGLALIVDLVSGSSYRIMRNPATEPLPLAAMLTETHASNRQFRVVLGGKPCDDSLISLQNLVEIPLYGDGANTLQLNDSETSHPFTSVMGITYYLN